MKPFQKISKIAVALFCFTILISCTGDSEIKCFESLYVATKSVTGPTTAAVNETITLNVSFEVQSSCGNFVKFEEDIVTPNEKKIAIAAKYDGCACTIKPFTRVAPYTFNATTAGTYVLKFKITSVSFVTHTIVVS